MILEKKFRRTEINEFAIKIHELFVYIIRGK